MNDLLSIDGSFGEGGGQIIRTSVSLAAMTGRAVEIYNVRARRTRPGLQPQHVAAVRAAASLCQAAVSGDSAGSSHFRFEPQSPVIAGDYNFEIGTAGAASLVAQTVLVPLTLASGSSTVRITGGTHVPHSPPADYLESVYIPILQSLGLNIELSYSSAGFYPKGGGEINARIGGSGQIQSLDWRERGRLQDIRAFVVTSNLPEHVAERGANTVEKAMKAVGRKVGIERRERPSPGPGAAVVLTATCDKGRAGFSSVGELRRPMEKVATAPTQEFMRWWKSGSACDEHLADQLVLPLSFANGSSHWTTPVVTEHLRTVLWVVKQFLSVRAHVDENEDGVGTVSLSPESL